MSSLNLKQTKACYKIKYVSHTCLYSAYHVKYTICQYHENYCEIQMPANCNHKDDCPFRCDVYVPSLWFAEIELGHDF